MSFVLHQVQVITRLGLKGLLSRVGDNALKVQVVCPQNGAAVLEKGQGVQSRCGDKALGRRVIVWSAYRQRCLADRGYKPCWTPFDNDQNNYQWYIRMCFGVVNHLRAAAGAGWYIGSSSARAAPLP